MKKILITVMIILLSIIAYTTVVNGYHIGKIEILGLKGIEQKSNELNQKIEEAEKLRNVTYLDKINDLNTSAKDLMKEKKSYEELVSYSSAEDVEKANQLQQYEIEVLWTKIGMHAYENNVKLKFEVVESSSNTPNTKDLKFTATGAYIPITDFISDLEKDAKLSFTIEGFELIPTASEGSDPAGRNLQATFRVKDIVINLDTTKI